MANNPIPDQGNDFIESGMTLITDPRSDKYLNMVGRDKKNPPKDRFTDYVERH